MTKLHANHFNQKPEVYLYLAYTKKFFSDLFTNRFLFKFREV